MSCKCSFLFAITFACLMIAFPFSAQARGPILLGVSDTGQEADYLDYSQAIDRHVPLLQTFHTWGTSLRQARLRWQSLRVRPVLHISLNPEKEGQELPSLRDIAAGLGDDYLVRLNEEIRSWGKPIYIRPLGEPNRPRNSYSAYLPDGSFRGVEYSPAQYRRAFRRISIVLRGGSLEQVNRKLRRFALPPVADQKAELGPTRAKIFFSPLPSSLGIRGNYPGRFSPGRAFYDAVGTSFFSAWPEPGPLERFYKRFARGKSFYFLEWGLNSGSPRFVDWIYRWCRKKKRCQGMIFYQGFADTAYRLQNYPVSLLRVKALSWRSRLYPLYTPEWAPSLG